MYSHNTENKLKKKVHLVSVTTYCTKSKAFTLDDILIETVNKEDAINHVDNPVKNIPELKSHFVPTALKKKMSIRQFIYAVLP